jgi:hypothetical protein
MRFLGLICLCLLIFGSSTHSASAADESAMSGPSLHLSLGARTMKAPSLDQFYSAYGGIKLSVINFNMGENMYLSILAAGVYVQRDALFAASISPLIFNHYSGAGISIDFFSPSSRTDRPGGPVGLALNIDVMKLSKFFESK